MTLQIDLTSDSRGLLATLLPQWKNRLGKSLGWVFRLGARQKHPPAGLDVRRLSDRHLHDLGFDPASAREDWASTTWRSQPWPSGARQRLGKSPLPPI